MKQAGSYAPEIRERAVRLVFEHEDAHDSPGLGPLGIVEEGTSKLLGSGCFWKSKMCLSFSLPCGAAAANRTASRFRAR